MPRRKGAVSAIQPGDEPIIPDSMLLAAEAGNAWVTLVALRRVIAKKLDDPETNGTAAAALANRMIQVQKEIDALEKAAAASEEERAGKSAEVIDGKFDIKAV
jgi:hypothetical protein